jgi:hypothetical protein
MRNAYNVLVGKPDGKRPFRRPTRSEIGGGGGRGLAASDSGYGPVAGPCKHGNEPSGSTKGG